ncbi:MAG: hypothetical protein ACLFP2_01575 [Candidatus Woesearchaeota archaeon]
MSGGLEGAMVFLNLSNSTDLALGNCTAHQFNSIMGDNNILKSVDGDCDNDNVISVTLVPEKAGTRVYAAQYLQTGSNHFAGNLQRGDVVKIYYEAPRDI